ncbi:helix-turn-helix transcriptional regulator [Rathayibacter sp. AY1F3]|uniref:helix-turn-helix domain-containing protein n=1 Tax=Rathayibacter sp. AY1F3 TaxID=2080558 RepID=UPI001CA53B8D|nr:helix-turn-helix transcriptional regulator [Rathayibacter sp. AY1F3]
MDSTNVNAAIGEAVKSAIYEAGFNVKAAAERAGLPYRTVLRYIKGERDMPVPVLLALVHATNADLDALVKQLRGRVAFKELVGYVVDGNTTGEESSALRPAELARRLSLVFNSRGLDATSSRTKISEILLLSGASIDRQEWGLLMTGQLPSAPRVDVLFAVAEALDIDPDYLLRDDPELVEAVEARLGFDGAMRTLGIERVAARSLGTIEPAELRGIAAVVSEIVTELRR